MQIILDRARCESSGLCVEMAAKFMHLDDKDDLILGVGQGSEADQVAFDAATAAHGFARLGP